MPKKESTMKQYFKHTLYIFLIIFTSCGENETDSKSILILLGLTSSVPAACSTTYISKEDRTIGMDILNTTETGTFDNNITLAKDAGIEFIGVHLTWTQFEDNTGSGATSGNFTDPNDTIKAFIDVVQAQNLKFSLTIRPIDITGKTVPADLTNTRFDDTNFQTRFKALINFVLNITGSDSTTTIQNYLTSLQIGNEIDGYDTSSEHADFWSHYGSFLNEMTQNTHSINSNIKVGYTATLNGATSSSNRDIFRALADAVDIIGITYYPLNSDFSVKPSTAAAADLQLLVDTFSDKGKTIYLEEVGYQSSAVNSSSESMQAQFYCDFFQAWDTHKDYIKGASFVRLNDISESDAQSMAAPYGISGELFKEYLRTLGLRTYSGTGTNKQAYDIIRGETLKRGW